MESVQRKSFVKFPDCYERELYFDTLNEAILTKIDGKLYQRESVKIFIPDGVDSITTSMQRLDPLKNLGKDYKRVFHTFLPAKEYEFYAEKKDSPQIFEGFLEVPLIKLKEKNFIDDQNQFLSGYLSGKRSCIVFAQNNLALRLKGCGNNFIGFNLGCIDVEGPEHFEIRGCQFKNTCLREIDITEKVNTALEKEGLLQGNVPIGYWIYDNLTQKYKELGLKNDCHLIDKYCSIFVTSSDKRLGFNFFGGLNWILKSLFENQEYKDFLNNKFFNFSSIKEKYESRFSKEEAIKVNFNDQIFESFDKQLKDYSNTEPINFLNLLEITKFQYDEEILNLEIKLLLESYHELIKLKSPESIQNTKTMSEEYFNKSVIFLGEKLKSKKMNLISQTILLLSKLCYEMGTIKRILEKEDINWGTYDYHSNAHLDNFILLPMNSKNLFLAPVDFDLAFTRDQFVDLKYKNMGKENEFDFDSLVRSEKNNLIFQISGLITITNLEVKVFDFAKETDLLFQNMVNLMYENNNYYFTAGYIDKEIKEEKSIFEENYFLGNELVRLVLSIDSCSRLK